MIFRIVNKFSLMNRSPNFHRENSDLKNSSNCCVSKFVENRWTKTNLSMFPLNPCTYSSYAQIRYREKKPTTPDHHKSKDSCRNREACRNIWSGFILNSKTFCQKSFWEGWELCWFWVGWSAPIVSWLPRWAWRQSVARHLSCHQHPFVRPFSSKPFLLRIIPNSTAVFIATFDKFVCSYSLLGVRIAKGGKIQILVKFCNHMTGIVTHDKYDAFTFQL